MFATTASSKKKSEREPMELPEEVSEIKKCFGGTSIFITGATGFLGKLLIEKLLRTCDGIEKIYILIREKKGKKAEERLAEILDCIVFDRLKQENRSYLDKIVIVKGDCILPDLGLSTDDQQKIIEEVSYFFHCAATVRFDEKVRTAAYINVRATRDILLLAKKTKKLKSLVYISTAYSYCVHQEIGEEFYEPPITGENFLKMVECLKDETLADIKEIILGKWPNPYAFTKAIAEDVVRRHGQDFPTAIIRPSVVISTAREPVGGWIDNFYGATGIFVGAALGLVRTLHCKKECIADMVPADNVLNCAIAAAWCAATEENSNNPIIYNYVMSNKFPLTWEQVMHMVEVKLKKIPSPLVLWYYYLTLNSNYVIHYLYLTFLHRIPAYVVDCLAMCLGKKPMVVKGYQKIEKFLHVVSYFATRTWKFKDENTESLWRKLNEQDKNFFEFGWDRFDLDVYFNTYCRGMRIYLMKDPMETLPQGRVKYLKLQIAHYVLVTVILLVLLKLLLVVSGFLF